jgi:acylaminoacyl-peptidase
MTHKLILLTAFLGCWGLPTIASTINSSLISKITIETADTKVALADNQFSKVVEQNFIDVISVNLDQGKPIVVFNEPKSWEPLSGEAEGTHILRLSLSASQYSTGKLKVLGAKAATLYLNNEAIKGNKEFSIELLNQDYRALLVVSGVDQWDDFSIEWIDDLLEPVAGVEPTESDLEGKISSNQTSSETNLVSAVTFDNDQGNKRASMKHYYDSETVGSLNISPDGELLVWSKRTYSDLNGDKAQSVVEIIDIDSQKVVYRWQAMSPNQLKWAVSSKALVFVYDDVLYKLQRNNWQLTALVSNVSGMQSVDWLSDTELLVSWKKPEKQPHAFTKRYRALQDRWSYWRGDLQLQLFDMQSGLFKQITNNPLASSLADVDPKSRTALITRSPIDYKEPPHGLIQLLSLDLNSGEETLLGEYRSLNSVQFHKEGYVIIAGPDFKDGGGNNVTNGMQANAYDGQVYLMDKQNKITPLSKNFKPAIGQVEVLKNGDLIVSTTDQDRRQLYQYDLSRKKFIKLDTKAEVVSGFTVSAQSKPAIVYKGTSATRPQTVNTRTLRSAKGKVLFDSSKQDFANIDFIDLKDWDYTTKSGEFIDGRVYYPANFDKNNKYPTIVYYYAGTTPVTRGFTGRWPFSLWASQGYVVYVLQPSGAIGYGQNFSARHVNAWGINTADEIIESTHAFVQAHPFVDEKRLGNMGASYGGFMTMYLATQTDMFAASISHAGISNLTSYWGHGWWGYGYSGVATKGSFPWNKTDFYTLQSPVFAADKVSTPLLLIHGDADTNVPVGESHQMYTALKLLDQDVELIEFQGDDHHINSRERRMRWWSTILAYFDMKLKDEALWWESLYFSETQN